MHREREREEFVSTKKVRNNNPLFLNQNFILCSHVVTRCWLRERECVWLVVVAVLFLLVYLFLGCWFDFLNSLFFSSCF